MTDLATCAKLRKAGRYTLNSVLLADLNRRKRSLINDLRVEASWPTNKRAVALVEAQVLVGGLSNADADADAEGAVCGARGGAITGGGRLERPQPQGAWSAEVEAVQAAVDFQRLGKPAWATCQVAYPQDIPATLHMFHAFQGLKSTDENTAARAREFGGDIQHEVIAIAEVDIGVAAAQEHRPIAGRLAAKMVRCRVLWGISLGLHDAPTESCCWQFSDDNLAHKKLRQRDGIGGEFSPAEEADSKFDRFCGAHGRLGGRNEAVGGLRQCSRGGA